MVWRVAAIAFIYCHSFGYESSLKDIQKLGYDMVLPMNTGAEGVKTAKVCKKLVEYLDERMISDVTLRRNSVMRRRYANQRWQTGQVKTYTGQIGFVGRPLVQGTGKPTEILAKLNELVGFAPDEDIELFELEDGDIICSLFSDLCSKLSGCALSLAGETQGGCQNSTIMTMLLKELHDLSLDNPSKIRLASNNCYSRQPKPQPAIRNKTRPLLHGSLLTKKKEVMDNICGSANVISFDGAFSGDGEEDVVMGEGVVMASSSLEMVTKSFLGEMMVSLIFLEGLEEEA
ncbi:hypothetical protein Tco_0356764 [Tanacetum coccineum]